MILKVTPELNINRGTHTNISSFRFLIYLFELCFVLTTYYSKLSGIN